MSVRIFYILIISIAHICLSCNPCTANILEIINRNQPRQITYETDPVLYMAISPDGKHIVYSSGVQGNMNLYLKPLDSSSGIFSPVQLTNAPLDEISPAFSHDNRFIAYTGTSDDVKGDIYLLDLENKKSKPIRLTGKETGDGAPCFSSKANLLYFHQTGKGSFRHRLAFIDLNDKNRKINLPRVNLIDTGGDCAFPCVSPDGSRIAFVSYRNDNAGDIFLLNLQDNSITQLTENDFIDSMPAWSADGNQLIFSSIRIDTDKNGKIDSKDNASIYRIDIDNKNKMPSPAFALTSSAYSALSPCINSSKLFYLSEKRGVSNCLSLPAGGQIPDLKNKKNQIALSEKIAAKIPFDPYLSILAWFKVLEKHFIDSYAGAKSGYEIGRLYHDMELGDSAFNAFDIVCNEFENIQPYAGLSQIYKTAINAQKHLNTADSPEQAKKILNRGLEKLNQAALIETESPANRNHIKARAMIMSAKLLHEYAKNSGSINKSIELLDNVINLKPLNRELTAEAMIIKADIVYESGFAQKSHPLYMQVIKTFEQENNQENKWTGRAVEQILNLSSSGLEHAEYNEKIKVLRRIVRENKEKYPILAAGALNRAGDIYYKNDEWAMAKNAYKQVLESFPGFPPDFMQKTRARFSLAEILYKQEHFRKALNLYETDLYEDDIDKAQTGKIPVDDNIFKLARAAYIRKSIGAAEFYYRLKEILAAQSRFKELIKYDDSIIEAHRGYIKCGAALKKLDDITAHYKKRMEQNPDNPVAVYSLALCMTYYEDQLSLEKAEKLLLKAIGLDSQKEYFYQTLGYVRENLETVYNKSNYNKSGNLQSAFDSYKTAWSLNDHINNPGNAANLLLNMANACFLLGYYEKALDYYNQRMDNPEPFVHENTEIMFYRRLGASAFQAKNPEKAIKAYDKALELIESRLNPVDDLPLEQPRTFMELKTEMLDRLGLAFQDNEKWENAVNCFEQVFKLNKELGLNKNLAKNKRAAAYCKYRMAEIQSGRAKIQTLESASKDFSKVIELVNTNGVPELKKTKAKKEEEKGLINLSQEQSLKKDNKTAAAFGFTADQEIRLAKAFISRINTELGNLGFAEKAIKEQLSQYPKDKPVGQNDLYGVSLLYHRAGHLTFARGNMAEAFENFSYSAQLSLKMKNPVSSGLNVSNMAHALLQIPGTETKYLQYKKQVEAYDIKAASLLTKAVDTAGPLPSAIYHNKMGVFYSKLRTGSANNLSQKILDTRYLQKAGIHFTKGIEVFENSDKQIDRKTLNLLSILHLNMAYTSQDFGESESAKKYFKTALKYSKNGKFPDFQWRAYAGLGNMDMALESLEKVTLFNAGVNKGEILNIFGHKIINLVQSGKIEQAFNLGEKLSELERFNIMAQYTGLASGKDLYRKLYPKLGRIKSIREKLKSAAGEDKKYLQTRLEQERLFIRTKIGKDLENLPELLRLMPGDQELEKVLFLLGFAAAAEKAAENFNPEYDALIEKYHKFRKQEIRARDKNKSSDIFTFLGPEYIEAIDIIDIMENIPGNKTMIRIFKVRENLKEYAIVFYLSPDDLRAEILDAPDLITPGLITTGLINPDKLSVSKQDFHEKYLLVYENPEELPDWMAKSCALSGSHYMRTFMNRKPFKKSLVCQDNACKSIENILGENYSLMPLPDFQGNDFMPALHQAQTLVLSGKISKTGSIPVRSGNIPEKFISLETRAGKQIRFEMLFAQSHGLSLAILQNAKIKDSYLLSHMTSILGCPSLLIPGNPTVDTEFLNEFLKSYPDNSAFDSLKPGLQPGKKWMLTGYRGMNPEQSRKFASDNFIKYVKQGQAAYKKGDFAYALSMFENAADIAAEIKKFEQYLVKIYEYGREAAYKAGYYEKAAEYAQKNLDLITGQKPDSQAHAEAMLRLGLIHARMENYEKAMPLLEESLEIMTALELGPKLISALEESGIVLENATKYEQAMLRFKSAASLSNNLMKDNLLARQYSHMGRVYDMRLSRYAPALQNYQKALEIYQDMEQPADISQSLLNMGRCYRLLGNFVEADKLYVQALKIIEPLNNSHTGNNEDFYAQASAKIIAKIIIEQANNAWYQARYQEAFRLQQKAYKISQKHDLPLLEVITLNTSGLIWWTLGDQKKALFELDKALKTAQKLTKRKDELATTLNNMGLVFRETGQYEKAMEKFDTALEIDTKIKSRWAIAYDLRNKAITFLLTNRPGQALPLFKLAADEAREIGNKINEAKSLLGLGQANAALKNFPEAKSSLNMALDLSKSMFIRETWWRALFELAKLELGTDRDKSINLLYRALDVIEQMRAEIKIEQLRDSFITNKLAVYETLAQLLADKGKIAESFEVAERSRARNFIDILGNRQLNLNNKTDQNLLEKQASIRAKIEENEALLANSEDKKEQETYKQNLKSLENDLKNLMLEIQANNPQLASLVSVEPLKTNDLYKIMEPGLVLVSYYVLPDELFCWRIADRDIKLFRTPINQKSFSQDILDFRRMIQNLEPIENLSGKLSNLILKPVISDLKDIQTLGIIPHKSLHYLSFATLAYNNDYLIDRFPIFYVPSASVLDITFSRRQNYKDQKNQNQKNLKVLAIGNPDLGDPAFDLPFSEHEVGSIQWNFPDITTKTRKEASEAWLAANISDFGIIHLASHGEFDPVNPLFSAIKLAKKDNQDGNLEAREVFSLKINADMVILSACQTGLGKVTPGDDVIGLNRSFLYAGTHTTISSLWRISDITSAILLKQFYRQYTKTNKAQSLRKAVLHVKNRYPHPGYWGAFTLVGDFQ